jgi:very-short-patch-repair endonuclease
MGTTCSCGTGWGRASERGRAGLHRVSSPLAGEVAPKAPEGTSRVAHPVLTAWLASATFLLDGPHVPSPETNRARELRTNMTTSEWRMWQHLRGRQMSGWKFRRQAAIGRYVVDFVCFAARLIVELDGSSHDGEDAQVAYEQRRQTWLEAQWYRVLRLHGRDIPERDPLEGAWETIDQAISETAVGLDPSRERPGSRAYRVTAPELPESTDCA